LKTVADLCRRVNENGRSMGMALTSCTVPLAGKPTFEIDDDQMEIGIGIHGEPGRQRVPLTGAREIIQTLAAAVIADLPFKSGDAVIAMVNGMGATPLIELYLAYKELAGICRRNKISIARRLVGNFITSLEMAGCSITLLKVDAELLKLWDEPVLTTGLRWGI
jgi:dihydroxyacetone kinase-like protein